LQSVVEAIEIIEQADGADQLHDFAFVVKAANVGPKLVVNAMGIAGDAFGQAQRDFLFFREIGSVFEIGQVLDLLVAVAVPSRLDGV